MKIECIVIIDMGWTPQFEGHHNVFTISLCPIQYPLQSLLDWLMFLVRILHNSIEVGSVDF